jgi:hypothetical protein
MSIENGELTSEYTMLQLTKALEIDPHEAAHAVFDVPMGTSELTEQELAWLETLRMLDPARIDFLLAFLHVAYNSGYQFLSRKKLEETMAEVIAQEGMASKEKAYEKVKRPSGRTKRAAT